MIRFHCSSCDSAINAPDPMAGKRAKCPNCSTIVTVPGLAASPAEFVVDTPPRRRRAEPLDDTADDSPARSGQARRQSELLDTSRSNSFGIASLVVGVLSICLCWVPALGFGLSGLGIALGVLGLVVAAIRGGSGLGYCVAGGCLSGFALAPSLWWVFVISPNRDRPDHRPTPIAMTDPVPALPAAPRPQPQPQQPEPADRKAEMDAKPTLPDPKPQAEKAAPEPPVRKMLKQPPEPEWVSALTPVKIGDVVVRIEDIRANKVKVMELRDIRESTDRYLQIELVIENHADKKILEFLGWGHADAFATPTLKLSDNFGNSYRRRGFGALATPLKQVRFASVYPMKTSTDLLVFNLPVDGFEFLRLELNAANVKGQGWIRFEIPAKLVTIER